MKKRSLSTIFALALCLLLLPAAAFAEERREVDNNTTELDGGYYYLSTGYTEALPGWTWEDGGRLELANTIHVTAASTLDLSGYTLSAENCSDLAERQKTILVVDSGATLTLMDSCGGDGGSVGGFADTQNSTNAAIVVESGGKLVLDSGMIVGFGGLTDNGSVGGVYVKSGGTFEMNGGKIKNCKGGTAGGVYVEDDATFVMNGGTITDCTGKMAGGVYVEDGGAFEMNGGTITGCANGKAGGVYVQGGGTFELNDGTITGCTSTTVGGVYVEGGAQLIMSGGRIESCKNATMSESAGVVNTTSATTVYVAQGGKLSLSGDAWIGKGSTTPGNIRDLYIAGELDAAGGTVCGSVQYSGDIASSLRSETEFTGSVNMTGSINAGTFNGNVTVNNSGYINAGTFNGNVTISGDINGGTFNGNVTINGNLRGGTFNRKVDITGAINSAPLFTESSTVTLKSADSYIYLGTFRGTVDNTVGATVWEGDFTGATLINIAAIHFYDAIFQSCDVTFWRYNAPLALGDDPKPEAAGHIFKGWYYREDAESSTLKKLVYDELGGAVTFNITQDMDLTPAWSPITYTVRLDDGGEQYSDFPATTEYHLSYDGADTFGETTDLPCTISLPTMTMEGRRFVGWKDDEGNVYSGEVKNLATENNATLVLYPKWAGHTVELSYNCSGGTHPEGTLFSEHAIAGGTMTYPSDPTREGYRFTGWTPQVTEVPDCDTTFTAQWDANIVQVSSIRGNKKNYPNIEIAHDAAGSGDRITLLANVSSKDLTAVRDDLTVDLGGYTATVNLTFTGDDQVLCNGTLNGTVTVTGSGFSFEDVTVTGLVTLGGDSILLPGTVLQGGVTTSAADKLLSDHLARDAAFELDGSIVSGDVTQFSGAVSVVSHTRHDYGFNGKCPCGAQQPYTDWDDDDTYTPSVTVPVFSDSAQAEIKATVSKGSATVNVSSRQIDKLASDGADDIMIDLSALEDVESAVIPCQVVKKVHETGNTSLTAALPAGSVSLDEAALESIAGAAGSRDVTISVAAVPTEDLSPAVRKLIGADPTVVAVVDVNITAGKTKLSSFDGGTVTVSIPYAPKKGEDTGRLTVWFVRDDGTIENIGGWYDAENQCFVFETGHLSQYLLVDPNEKEAVSFTDVPDSAYYAAAVNWAAGRGIADGIGDTCFGPDLTCTRAQLVTFLYRAAAAGGMDVSVGADTNILSCTDAFDISEYAMEAFQWAVGAGIVQGADGKLMPNDTCTRAQVVTMLFRFAAVSGMDAVTLQELVGGYSDAAGVPGYALPAFNWALASGIVQGANGSLMANNACTRAQIVTMLYRLLGE